MISKKVLIVGVGNIGKRYLQALDASKKKIHFHLLEKNEKKILELKRFLKRSKYKNKISIYSRLNDLQENTFYLAVVATTANFRTKITKIILKNKQVKNWIIEKPLGQSIKDISFFESHLNLKNSWINLPRKSFKCYRTIKKIIRNEKIKEIGVSGNNWGVCCNGIHFINLFGWLLNSKLEKINIDNIVKWKKTKRKNFFETEGKMLLKFSNNYEGYLQSTLINNKKKSCVVNIKTNKKKITFSEIDGKIYINEKLKYKNEYLPFLSSYITKIFNNIYENKKIELPYVKSSINEHLIFIKELNKSWNILNQSKKKFAPIT